jgi:hypothetical protein
MRAIRIFPLLTLLLGMSVSSAAVAVAPVEAVALFKGRAVVRTLEGEEMLKVGETSQAGVTLLAASPMGATVLYGE